MIETIPRGEIAIEFVTQHLFYFTDCCCLKYFLVTRMCHVHFSHQKDHHHSVCAKSMNQHKVQLFHEKSIFIVKIQDYSPKCWSLKVNFQTELRTLLNLTAACHLFCWTHFRSRFIDVFLSRTSSGYGISLDFPYWNTYFFMKKGRKMKKWHWRHSL